MTNKVFQIWGGHGWWEIFPDVGGTLLVRISFARLSGDMAGRNHFCRVLEGTCGRAWLVGGRFSRFGADMGEDMARGMQFFHTLRRHGTI